MPSICRAIVASIAIGCQWGCSAIGLFFSSFAAILRTYVSACQSLPPFRRMDGFVPLSGIPVLHFGSELRLSVRDCLSSSLLGIQRSQNRLIPRHRHFVAAVPLAWRAVRPSVDCRSWWYRERYAQAVLPARLHRQDIVPGNCVRRYAATYARSFVSAPIRAPRHLAPAHRSSVASLRSKADLSSGSARARPADCRGSGVARRARPLSLLGRSSNEESGTLPMPGVLRH